MNKLFTKIAAIVLGATMATGVGVAVASNTRESTEAYAATGDIYEKVTSASDIADGDLVIFVNQDGTQACGTTQNTNNRTPVNITLSDSKYTKTSSDDVQEFAVKAGSTSGQFGFHTGTGYIYSASSSKNYLKTNTTAATTKPSDTSAWTISISSGVATVLNATNTSYYLAFNGTSYFSQYKTGQSKTTIYKKSSTSEKYTVSFNGNGASGSMSSVTDVFGSYTLPANGFTVPTGKAFAGWKANNAGDLIAAGGSYTVSADVEFYAQWADAYDVTYTAGTNGTGSYAHTSQPAGTYTLLPFASLTGVSANSGYRFKDYSVGGVNKNPGDTITLSAATSVTVNFEVKPLEGTYDFTINWSTYASSWGGYAAHDVTGTDVDAEYEASISFTNVSKQSGTITDRPVIAAKSGTTSTMLFTLDSSVSATLKITTVEIAFAQWSSSKKVAAALYKGATVSGSSLDSFAQTDTPRNLTTSNLNGDTFIVDFTTTETSNQQLGVTSITIGLAVKSSFGTLDHISISSLPNTVYHVGETYSSTGLAVTAYDGADESTANFKDVTTLVETDLDDPTPFVESDVPGFDCDVQYTGDGGSDITSFHVYVYALVEYELVTSEPTDWSGEYLLVSSYTDASEVTHTVAINSSLTNFDQPLNFKEVTVSGNSITTGQELEWTFASFESGYSLQGKNGKYAYGNSNNRFMTSDSAQQLTISFASNIATITGATGYNLRMNSSTAGGERFGFYNTGTADIQLYKLVESSTADAYAQTFLGAIVCDATGASEPTYNWKEEGVTRWSWSLLATEYDTLSATDKEQFRLGVASSTGSNIEKALAVYDYIVGKYNKGMGKTSEYPDFMERDPSPIGAINNALLKNVNTENTIAIVVVISTISVSAIGGYFFLRKRKEHN